MTVDLTSKSDKQLEVLIDNHEKQGATDRPLYMAALTELGRRSSFSFEVSLKLIEEAASETRFLSYGDVAAANGVDWNSAYRQISAHLWELVRFGHGKGLPMLTAVIVSKPNQKDGQMEGPTLEGFTKAAEALGYRNKDNQRISVSMSESAKLAFLREQQAAIFAHFTAHPTTNSPHEN